MTPKQLPIGLATEYLSAFTAGLREQMILHRHAAIKAIGFVVSENTQPGSNCKMSNWHKYHLLVKFSIIVILTEYRFASLHVIHT